jgi:hypothetical protein
MNNISQIKIFGERNSGTNYIKRLLTVNLKTKIKLHSGTYTNPLGWKHCLPDPQTIINKKNTLIIFIIRNLEEWLNSMYFRPYHLKGKKNFNDFITERNKSKEHRKNHPVNLFSYEKENLFQIRYKKFKRYLTFLKEHNVILINLKFAQQEPQHFLILISKFGIITNKNFKPILKHTKTGKKTSDDMSHQKFKISSDIYGKYADHEIETYINNLSHTINII